MYIQNKYYKILNSSKYDDIETIKRNYKQIIFDNHPDKGGDEELAKEVNIAWEIIKKYHIQQTKHSNKQETNNGTKHTNTGNKTSNTTNKQKTNTNKSYSKNNGQSSKCNSKYNKSNEDIELLCIGVVFIGIGLFLLSICWPIGIIYFYGLYKYLSS